MTTVTLAGLFILMIMIGKPSCHGPGTVLSVPHLLIQFSQQPYQVGVVNITPPFTDEKTVAQRGEVNHQLLTQWPSGALNPGILALEPH